jgi:ornithine cyclodeaminase/alanine dehydrogenase-like protein (mu-crystallin family)
MDTLILQACDIRKIVQTTGLNRLMDEMISRLSYAFESYNPQQTIIPVRSGFSYTEPKPGLVEWMPVMIKGSQVAIKVVGYHPENPQSYHLPTIISTISAYDPLSGHLTAVADATFITALRTGAASAVASTCLGSDRTGTVGIIGAGAQAVTQLHALSRVFPIQKVLVFDVIQEVTSSFLERTRFLGLQVEPVILEDLDWLVQSADILTTCTSVGIGEGPVFQDTDLKPWLHINAVGADFPGKFEVPFSVLQRSTVCPDFRGQAVVEGECQQFIANDHLEAVGPDLAELVKNRSNYTWLREEMTVFDSTGWALEDQVALELFLDYAQNLGVGTRLDIEQLPVDPKDPYEIARMPENSLASQKERG